MNYCPSCGKSIGEKVAFCPNCGTALTGNLATRNDVTHTKKKIILVCTIALIVLLSAIVLILALSKGGTTTLSKDEIGMSDLVGEWVGLVYDSTIRLNADGSWEDTTNQNETAYGTWSFTDGKLILHGDWQECYYIMAYRKGYLYMSTEREGENPRYGIRSKRADYNEQNDKVELLAEEKKIVGSWVASRGSKLLRIDFFEDGRFKEWTEKNGQVTDSYPIDEWFITGDYLILIGDHDGGSMLWHYIKFNDLSEDYIIGIYSWVQDETLELTRCK